MMQKVGLNQVVGIEIVLKRRTTTIRGNDNGILLMIIPKSWPTISGVELD